MNDFPISFGLLILTICMVALLIAFFYLWKKKKRERACKAAGDKGERLVAAQLKRTGRFRRYRIVNDLYLPMKEGLTQIDHIVVGPFGILVVESKYFSGQVYGNPSEERWLHIHGGKKHTFYNPILQNQTHINAIRAVLAQQSVYNVPIFSLVVFAGRKLDLMVPRDLPVISIKKLKRELRRREYKRDRGINAKEIATLLQDQAVVDKKQLKEHKKYVKSKR